jgi:hypothetical protein
MAGAVIAAKDMQTVRSLYISQLGFEKVSGSVDRLSLPGGAGDEIEIEAAGPNTKPRIWFPVADVAKAEKELRNRGLAVQKSGNSVSVTDPDGAVIVFAKSGNTK